MVFRVVVEKETTPVISEPANAMDGAESSRTITSSKSKHLITTKRRGSEIGSRGCTENVLIEGLP